MNATINPLWETGREVVSFNGSEFEFPASIRDLQACENVLIGSKVCRGGPTEVLIDNEIVLVMPRQLRHPSGSGLIYVLEVM